MNSWSGGPLKDDLINGVALENLEKALSRVYQGDGCFHSGRGIDDAYQNINMSGTGVSRERYNATIYAR